jgi:hypothetical protein
MKDAVSALLEPEEKPGQTSRAETSTEPKSILRTDP